MSESDNLELIRNVYGMFARGDVPAILETLTDDIDWHLLGPAEMPLGRPRRGKEEVLQFFRTIGEELKVESFEPHEFLADGDRVVVTGFEKMRVAATGRSYEVEWLHLFTVRDGRIARFREYTDTAAVLAAQG